MSDGGRGGERAGHPRREFQVSVAVASVVGYVVGLVAVTLALDAIDALRPLSTEKLVLILVGPLVPIVVLLALTGRIARITGPFGIEVVFVRSGHGASDPDPDPNPNPTPRRGIVAALLVIVGSALGIGSRDGNVDALLDVLDTLISDNEGEEGSSPTPTATDARTDTSAEDGATTGSVPDDYGERTYGQDEYGG